MHVIVQYSEIFAETSIKTDFTGEGNEVTISKFLLQTMQYKGEYRKAPWIFKDVTEHVKMLLEAHIFEDSETNYITAFLPVIT